MQRISKVQVHGEYIEGTQGICRKLYGKIENNTGKGFAAIEVSVSDQGNTVI